MLIIGITGTLGAGKGTVVDYLVKNKDYTHFSVREYLSELIKKDGNEINRTTLVDKGNELRQKFGPDYIAKEIFKKAKGLNKNCIIESLRTPGEVESLQSMNGFTLLAVDANQKVRYKRIYERASETDKISFEEFVANEKREMKSTDPTKQNLSKCIAMADYLIDNDKDLNNLYEQIEKITN